MIERVVVFKAGPPPANKRQYIENVCRAIDVSLANPKLRLELRSVNASLLDVPLVTGAALEEGIPLDRCIIKRIRDGDGCEGLVLRVLPDAAAAERRTKREREISLPFLTLDQASKLAGVGEPEERITRLLDLFKHWDGILLEKEKLFLPLTLAPFAAALVAWKSIDYAVVTAMATACILLYNYHLAVVDRFVLIQLAIAERLLVLDYEEFASILDKEHGRFGVIGLRIMMLGLIAGLWISFIYMKHVADPSGPGEPLTGVLTLGRATALVLVAAAAPVFYMWRRYGKLFTLHSRRMSHWREFRPYLPGDETA